MLPFRLSLLAVGSAMATMLGTAVLGPDTPVAAVIGLNLFFGLGMAAVMTPLMVLSLSSPPARDTADGSAILNTVQQLAGGLLSAAAGVGALRIRRRHPANSQVR